MNETHPNESRIRRSEEIGELAKALCKARTKIPAIEKHTEGQKGKQKYKYADLPAIYSAAIPHLSEAGIVHMQFPTYDNDRFIVTTMLVHSESGQWIESDCAFAYNANSDYAKDPKEQGLTITYIRRYAFIAAVGIIAGGDDDEAKLGNNAPNQPNQQQQPRRPFQSAQANGGQNGNGKPAEFDAKLAEAKCIDAMEKRGIERKTGHDLWKVWRDAFEADTGETPGRDAYAKFFHDIINGEYDDHATTTQEAA